MGFARRLLAFFLGMIVGILCIAGGIVGAAAFFKVKDVGQLVGGDDPIFGEELGNETILSLIIKILDNNNTYAGMETLEDVNKNFPVVETQINKMVKENAAYASLLGVKSFDDIKSWKINDIGTNAIEAAKQNATLLTVSAAVNLDLTTLGLPLLSDTTIYVKLDVPTLNRISNFTKKGLCYKSGESYLAAYNEDGTLVGAADGQDIYYHQSELLGLGIDKVLNVFNSLFKNESGAINLQLFDFNYIKQSFGIDVFKTADILNAFFSPDESLSVIQNFSAVLDRLKGKTLTEFFSSTTQLDSLKTSIEGLKILTVILNYGTEKELSIGNLLDGKKYVWNEDGTIKTDENGAPITADNGESYLIKGLYNATLSDAGITLNESDALYKFTHDADGNELSIRKLKDGIGDKKLSELITTDQAFLNSLLALSINDLSDAKKYTWDENGVKTEVTTGGETQMDHALSTIKMADVMNIPNDTTDAVLKAIKDLTVKDLSTDGKIKETINGLKIGDIIGVNDTSNAAIQAIKDLTVGELSDGTVVDEKIKGMYLADLITADNAILKAICFKDGDSTNTTATNKVTVGGISAQMDTLTIGKVIDTTGNKVLTYLSDALLTAGSDNATSLNAKIESMTLADVMDIPTDNRILNYLKNAKVTASSGENSLSALIDGMTVADAMAVDENSSSVIKAIANFKINELGTKIDTVKLGDIIGTNANAVMNAFKDLTIGQLSDSTAVQEKVNGIALKDILTVGENDKLMNAICYGADGAAVTVGGLSQRVGELKIGDVVATDGNKILTYLKDATLNGTSLSDKINAMTIGDAIAIDENSPKLLQTIKGKTLEQLGTLDINDMALIDVVDVGTSGLLFELANQDGANGKLKISELETGINKLKLSSVLDTSSNKMLDALKDSTIENLPNALNNLDIATAFDITTFAVLESGFTLDSSKMYFTKSGDTYTQTTAPAVGDYVLMNPDIWLAILFDGGYDKASAKYSYTAASVTVSTVSARVSSVASSIGTKTLRELKMIGLISTYPTTPVDCSDKTLNEFLNGTI